MAKAATQKSNKKASKLIPSLLAFERKLDPSDGLMFAGKWEGEDWQPIIPYEMRGRGTKSQLGVSESEMAETNIACGDVAALPMDCDTLKVEFTLRILPEIGISCGCDQAKSQEIIKKFVAEFQNLQSDEGGFALLAYRYAWNIASGRFLWRNRRGATTEDLKIKISQSENGKKTLIGDFSAAYYSLRNFDEAPKEKVAFEKLVNIIEAALRGKNYSVLLEIEAFRRIGRGQSVYPSQEFIDNKKAGDNSRVFYKLPYEGTEKGIAGIHSQKIGNALRTIDTWYPNAEENYHLPISVEPYGAVPTQGQSFRSSKNGSFYAYLEKVLKEENLTKEEAAFFVAVLIRGGVFGGNAE